VKGVNKMDKAEVVLQLKLENIPSGSSDAQIKEELLTRECELLINEAGEMGVRASFPKKAATKYARGIEMVIGSVILTAVTTEAIKFLFQYIKNRIKAGYQQDYRYEMLLEKGGESKRVKFMASNLTEEEIRKIAESMKKFIV
jgi:hypothetical protein